MLTLNDTLLIAQLWAEHKYEGNKFKVNDIVKYRGEHPEFTEDTYVVMGVNLGDEGFEYLLLDAPCLVWEHEIELIERP